MREDVVFEALLDPEKFAGQAAPAHAAAAVAPAAPFSFAPPDAVELVGEDAACVRRELVAASARAWLVRAPVATPTLGGGGVAGDGGSAVRIKWNSLSKPVTWPTPLLRGRPDGVRGFVVLSHNGAAVHATPGFGAKRYSLIVDPSHPRARKKRSGDSSWLTKPMRENGRRREPFLLHDYSRPQLLCVWPVPPAPTEQLGLVPPGQSHLEPVVQARAPSAAAAFADAATTAGSTAAACAAAHTSVSAPREHVALGAHPLVTRPQPPSPTIAAPSAPLQPPAPPMPSVPQPTTPPQACDEAADATETTVSYTRADEAEAPFLRAWRHDVAALMATGAANSHAAAQPFSSGGNGDHLAEPKRIAGGLGGGPPLGPGVQAPGGLGCA